MSIKYEKLKRKYSITRKNTRRIFLEVFTTDRFYVIDFFSTKIAEI